MPAGNKARHRTGRIGWLRAAVLGAKQQGISPMDVEYEEHPRGRVIYNTKTQLFTLLADQCILSDKGIISIMSALKLPRNIEKDGDGHYRCLTCLRSKFGRRGQEGWFRHPEGTTSGNRTAI